MTYSLSDSSRFLQNHRTDNNLTQCISSFCVVDAAKKDFNIFSWVRNPDPKTRVHKFLLQFLKKNLKGLRCNSVFLFSCRRSLRKVCSSFGQILDPKI